MAALPRCRLDAVAEQQERSHADRKVPTDSPVFAWPNTEFRFGVLFQDLGPAVLPIDVPVLGLRHLAATAAGIERSDDAVAHLVGGRELRVGIPQT